MNSIKAEMDRLPSDPEALRFHLKLVAAAEQANAPYRIVWRQHTRPRESIAIKPPQYAFLSLRDRAPAYAPVHYSH